MNILFVNNFYNIFAKADCGASQRTMCMIRALAKIGHVDVITFVDDTVSNEKNVDVVFSQEIGRTEQEGNRFNKFFKLFYGTKPYKIFPENKQKSEVVDRFVQQKRYDCIVTRYLYFACDCGLLKYKNRLLLDFDDDMRDTTRMEAQRDKSFRNKIYGYLYSYTMYAVSCYVAKHIRHAFYSSPNRPLPNADFLPNISAYTEPLPAVDFRATKPVMLLVGNFRYYPNEYGLLRFVRDIFPEIRALIADAEVHVVGNIPNYMMDRIKPYIVEGVKLCGFEPQLTDAYRESRCVVVPIWHGTGTSVKLVEAMALNRAVVTTTMGVRGLHEAFKPNEDYLLADENEQFVENVVRLLTNEERNKQLSRSALGKLKKHYSTELFEKVILENVKTGR